MSVETELVLRRAVARNRQDSSGRLPRADAANRSRHDRPRVRRSAVQHRLRVRRVPRPAGRRGVHRLVAAVDGGSPPRAQAGRHVLAGDRRRIRGRAEGRRRAQDRLRDAQLGRVVLHVRRQLHARSSRARTPTCSTSSRTRTTSRSMPRTRRSACRRPGRWCTPTSGRTRPAGCRTTRGCCGRRILPDGFQPTDDTWYYARVAGTFKERQGFHGCQMPEQLLGRIIRVSSNPGDIVLDPFAGSGTTLAVAKKLGRQWIGCELSEEYVRAATERLERDSRRRRARWPGRSHRQRAVAPRTDDDLEARPTRRVSRNDDTAASDASELDDPMPASQLALAKPVRTTATQRDATLRDVDPRRDRRSLLRRPRRLLDRLAAGQSAACRPRFTTPAAKPA